MALVGPAMSTHAEDLGRIIELTLGRTVPGASADIVEDALEGARVHKYARAMALALAVGRGGLRGGLPPCGGRLVPGPALNMIDRGRLTVGRHASGYRWRAVPPS